MLVQIDTLYSLENVGSSYFFDTETLSVINAKTNQVKKVSLNKRGYPVVYLGLKTPKESGRATSNIPMHKLVALAMIRNAPYRLIEHLDDNKLDYRPGNLKFSTPKANGESMSRNGRIRRNEKVFKLKMVDGSEYTGTMKALSAASGIPRATLYDRFYFERANTASKSKHMIKHIDLLSQPRQ